MKERMATSSKRWSGRGKQNESEKVVGIDLTCSCKFPNSLAYTLTLSSDSADLNERMFQLISVQIDPFPPNSSSLHLLFSPANYALSYLHHKQIRLLKEWTRARLKLSSDRRKGNHLLERSARCIPVSLPFSPFPPTQLMTILATSPSLSLHSLSNLSTIPPTSLTKTLPSIVLSQC